MAINYGGLDISFAAAEDLSGHQYRFVHMATNATVDLLDGATEFPIGILQNAPESGEIAVVRVKGTSKLVFNAAVAVGTFVKAEYVGAADNGKGDAADTDGDIARAVCIQASGAEDDVGGVLLCHSQHAIVSSPSASVSPSASSSPSLSPSASVSPSASASPST